MRSRKHKITWLDQLLNRINSQHINGIKTLHLIKSHDEISNLIIESRGYLEIIRSGIDEENISEYIKTEQKFIFLHNAEYNIFSKSGNFSNYLRTPTPSIDVESKRDRRQEYLDKINLYYNNSTKLLEEIRSYILENIDENNYEGAKKCLIELGDILAERHNILIPNHFDILR